MYLIFEGANVNQTATYLTQLILRLQNECNKHERLQQLIHLNKIKKQAGKLENRPRQQILQLKESD